MAAFPVSDGARCSISLWSRQDGGFPSQGRGGMGYLPGLEIIVFFAILPIWVMGGGGAF